MSIQHAELLFQQSKKLPKSAPGLCHTGSLVASVR